MPNQHDPVPPQAEPSLAAAAPQPTSEAPPAPTSTSSSESATFPSATQATTTEDDPSATDPNASSARKRDADWKMDRVQLACFYCRAKRIRCSGQKPVCSACVKASVECEWPAGRRPKRTRREMEEARRAEAAVQAVQRGQATVTVTGHTPAAAALAAASGLASIGADQRPRSGSSSGAPSSLSSVAPLAALASGALGGAGQDALSIDPWAMVPCLSSAFQWPTSFLPDPSPDGFSFDALGAPPVNELKPSISSLAAGVAPLPANETTMSGIGAAAELGPALAGFLHDNSPGTDLRLLSALESHGAYIRGNPGADEDLELYYYRFSGSTAINPGINRISLKLQRRPGHTPAAAPEPDTGDDDMSPVAVSMMAPSISPTKAKRPPPDPSELFDVHNLPRREIWDLYFNCFMANISCHFPSVSRRRMTERYDSGTMSAFLASCICALGARFSEVDQPLQACAPFVEKAQSLVAPLLHLPTHDTATGMMMLSWACFGQNSDSGLWQYSGMAIRMAIDLGMNENSDLYESAAHLVRIRILFWNMFVTDRVVSFAAGRPASIPEDMCEIPLPVDEDFFPDRDRDMPGCVSEPVQPVPYVYLTRLMVLCGRISNVLNGRRGRARTLVGGSEGLAERLAELQARLVSFYASLPVAMTWSTDNFKYQAGRGHGGSFLALHVWANAVLALIYHPDLLKSPSGMETPLNRSMPRNLKLAIASSRQICECMVFADLVSDKSYIGTPSLVQPLFIAGMALIHDMHATQASEAEGNPSDLFLVSMTRQNFMVLLKAILRIETYWAGATTVAELLQKRSGINMSQAMRKRTLISLPDTGLLRRYDPDISDHPQDLGPPTETSLRNSIARNTSLKDTLWISDLLSGYSVETMSFAPADSIDLARLVALSPGPSANPEQ